MARRTWLIPALLAVLALGDAAALGHDYVLIRAGQKPAQGVVLEHPLGQRKFSMRIGETATLVVRDISTPPCTAKITVVHAIGTTASITPTESKGFVRNQPFTITAKSLGDTTFQIGVVGEAANGGRSDCAENSVNDVVVTVLPNPAAATMSAGDAFNVLNKTMRADLTMSLTKTKSDVANVRGDVFGGQVPPTLGTWMIMDRYFTAFRDGATERRTVVDDFRTSLVGILNAGGYTPDCEPRGFGAGYRAGVWSSDLRTIGSQIRMYDDKLRTGLSNDMTAIEKRFNSEFNPFLIDDDCCCDDCCCDPPLIPTVSAQFVQAVRNRLAFDLIGAISAHDAQGQNAGYLWAAGHADPAKGDVKIDLLSGDGFTTTKTGTVGSDGLFRINFDPLKTGFAYRLSLNYATSPNSRSEDRIISMPWIREQF